MNVKMTAPKKKLNKQKKIINFENALQLNFIQTILVELVTYLERLGYFV